MPSSPFSGRPHAFLRIIARLELAVVILIAVALIVVLAT